MKNINAKISFNLKDFNDDKASVLRFLRCLKRNGNFKRSEEIDNFFSQQPSYAYKYVNLFLVESKYNYETKEREFINSEKNRLSPENEKVFKKNIKFAIAYLSITGQTKFSDDKIQKFFEKKVYSNAGLSYDYARMVLKGRIPEDKEIVFIENFNALYSYSRNILKGKFPEHIHKKIVLETFNDDAKNKWGYDALTNYIAQNFSKLGRNDYSYYRY